MYYYQREKHKVFFSFYHKDDQRYKDYVDNYFSNDIIKKSVKDGEYNTEISDEYVKKLIREDKISDSSVIVVLVGSNTRKRKHVDWEIYAGLRESVNGSAGLIGVLLPSFPLSPGNKYRYDDLPARLADNVKSGYSDIYTWDVFKKNHLSLINKAFENRILRKEKRDNTRLQMKRNLGENE